MARYTITKLETNFEMQKLHQELILLNEKIKLPRRDQNAKVVK